MCVAILVGSYGINIWKTGYRNMDKHGGVGGCWFKSPDLNAGFWLDVGLKKCIKESQAANQKQVFTYLGHLTFAHLSRTYNTIYSAQY